MKGRRPGVRRIQAEDSRDLGRRRTWEGGAGVGAHLGRRCQRANNRRSWCIDESRRRLLCVAAAAAASPCVLIGRGSTADQWPPTPPTATATSQPATEGKHRPSAAADEAPSIGTFPRSCRLGPLARQAHKAPRSSVDGILQRG